MSVQAYRSRSARVRTVGRLMIGALFVDLVAALLTAPNLIVWWWLLTVALGVFFAALAAARRSLPDASAALSALGPEDVESALLIEGQSHEVEVLLRSGDTLSFVFSERADAQRLIARLGFEAGAKRTTFVTRSTHEEVRSMVAAMGFGVLASSYTACTTAGMGPDRGAALTAAIAFLTMSFVFWRILRARRIVVGADAIVAERVVGSRRIPMASVVDAKATRRGAEVRVRDARGERWIRISPIRGARSAALSRRIREGIAMRAPATSAPLLARGGRSIAEWRASLRGVGAGGGYRHEGLPVEHLVRVAADADAPLDQRIGAALAVGSAGDADARSKLRIAVESLADDDTRRAMRAATEGEIEDAALDALTSATSR